MHLHAFLAAVGHHRHVGGDDGRHTGFDGCIDDGVHRLHILVVDDGVDREIGLDVMRPACGDDVVEVVEIEVVGGVGAHVELSHTEVDGVGTSLDSRRQ